MLDRVKEMTDNIKPDAGLAEDTRFFEISLLLDFYGQLLTARQYEILSLYYNDDYSLAEIAEELGISRQGVHDSIRKGRAALEAYEARLGLVARFREQEETVRKAITCLKKVEKEVPQAAEHESFREAVEALGKVMESL
jgi:Putative helix-turn-helix protein, YlxM / p13 like.